MQSFEFLGLPDFYLGIFRELYSIQREDTAVAHPPRSPTDSVIDFAEGRLTDHDQLSHSLDSSRTDSNDNSLNTSLPEVPIEMKPVQLLNQPLTQFKTKPSTEIHPAPFAETDTKNILDWLEGFNPIATHIVWNDQKQLQVISVYLKNAALNFYRSLSDQTKADVNLLKDALQDHESYDWDPH